MKKCQITLEVKVPDQITDEQAEDYFMFATGYACQMTINRNPMRNADYEVTDFKIEEL